MNLNHLKDCISNFDQEKLSQLKKIITDRKNIIVIGNGGSNAISSHIAEDYTKALGKRAVSFSDAARLTCYINDYGIEDSYTKFVEHFADPDTLVILISSSGNSKNITKAAEYCIGKHDLVLLSGFKKSNKLNSLSEQALLSFWVDSEDYGIVEISHLAILHSII